MILYATLWYFKWKQAHITYEAEIARLKFVAFCSIWTFCCHWNFCCYDNFVAIETFVAIDTFVAIGTFVATGTCCPFRRRWKLKQTLFGQIIEILAIVIRITQIVCKPLKGDAQLLIFDDGSDTCDWNVEFCLNFKGWVFSMIFRYSIFRYIPWKDYNRTQF